MQNRAAVTNEPEPSTVVSANRRKWIGRAAVESWPALAIKTEHRPALSNGDKLTTWRPPDPKKRNRVFFIADEVVFIGAAGIANDHTVIANDPHLGGRRRIDTAQGVACP